MDYIDDERLELRSYTKGELALLYSPRATRESAIRMLNCYLHRCHGLLLDEPEEASESEPEGLGERLFDFLEKNPKIGIVLGWMLIILLFSFMEGC